ncbi:MAG: DUF1553 domain-containing protein [Planctomycetota bacterium]|nr:DUF1553 domain-containing protein [Planctomycetota bacterium]
MLAILRCSHRIVRLVLSLLGPLVLLSLTGLSQDLPPEAEQTAKLDFFEKKIRPVLIEHCYECHSSAAKTLQGGLSLETAAGLAQGGDSGPALVPGKSDQSLILQALRYESTQMPPRGKLSDQVIADFVEWVSSGAADPRLGESAPIKKSIDFDQARQFWSFVSPKSPEIPTTQGSDWPESSIDHFTLAAMKARELSPVSKAGKRELIRRASFDLTGLPPTPQDVDSFLADQNTNAFARLIDRLLDSPAYGERWGRYWLDVARYSEDQAHTFSVQPNTHGYRYRDWVIAAFNSDMPFDLFVKYQIAADVMPIDEPQRLRNLAALGYFGLGAQYYKNTDAAKAAADELDDRIDTLTRGFLGLTVSCARCHDHKFDPIPQQDYYSLAGVFHSSRLHNAPLVPSPEVDRYNAAQQKIKELDEAIQQTIAREGPKIRESRICEIKQYLLATQSFQLAKSADSSLKLPAFAKANDLDPSTLKRWIDFLKSKESSPPLALRPWFNAIALEPKQQSEQQSDAAAGAFEDHLRLLLRQRDGLLSPEEQSKLTLNTPTGNARYISPMVTRTSPIAAIDVEIKGATELFLVVNDGGNGPSCDHADWLEPKLITASGEIALTEKQWETVSATFGSVNLDKSVTGQALRVAGKTYSKGIGTHATSVLRFELPDDALRFVALGGLDNSGSDQGGDCGTNATVQFRVYTETPTDIQVGPSDLLAEIIGEKGPFAMELRSIETKLPEALRETLAAQRSELEVLRGESPAIYPMAHVIAEATPSDLQVMVRGNPANRGEVAPRRFLRILSSQPPEAFTQGSGRLELADAIASSDNPLTARVMVNRIWQHHFGRGLVGTPDNFGKLGEPPTHPELLEYLTVKFMDQGWSIKSLHREIMLSATYQLSSDRNDSNLQIDADNRYLWRMTRRRLDVEAWRDALLATSGRLDGKLQGPSTNLADANNNRRTVYAFISRHELDNMLRLFDFPDANITASVRAETTVPQQQLFVLNSPFMIEQSKAFAARILTESAAGPEDRIQHAYKLAFGRSASPSELQVGLEYLQAQDAPEEKEHNKLDRWERYAQALLASNEFLYID